MVMEHRNLPFDSSNSLRTRNNGTIQPDTTPSGPRSSGFYNSLPALSTSSSPNNRNNFFRGNNHAVPFSDRNLIGANWRNATIATSQNNRAPFLSTSHSNIELSFASQLPTPYNVNCSPPGATRNMSFPTSPQADTSPTIPGTGQAVSNDAAKGTNMNKGGQKNGGALSMVQVSKALAQTAPQPQQALGRSGTDMPYYAYCFDRGNGQYTRLIPADMLPSLVDIPALQQGCLGMTVLPCPTGLAPNGRSSNLERVFVQVSYK